MNLDFREKFNNEECQFCENPGNGRGCPGICYRN